MSTLKKYFFIILFILLLLSVMHDLSKENKIYIEDPTLGPTIEIATIKVNPGDTVLSVVEEINEIESLNIEQIILDFEALNPGVNYKALIPHTFYYFPLYIDAG